MVYPIMCIYIGWYDMISTPRHYSTPIHFAFASSYPVSRLWIPVYSILKRLVDYAGCSIFETSTMFPVCCFSYGDVTTLSDLHYSSQLHCYVWLQKMKYCSVKHFWHWMYYFWYKLIAFPQEFAGCDLIVSLAIDLQYMRCIVFEKNYQMLTQILIESVTVKGYLLLCVS